MQTKRNTMRYISYFLLINILILSSDCQSVKSGKTNFTDYTLELIVESLTPLIDNNNPGSEGNKRGYEGGTVFMKDGIYHMFVTEEINGWVGTRTGYWQSKDGVVWDRISTIQQSVDKPDDPRNAVWSPMPFYNKNEERWNLFYVGYEKYGQTNGRIFRAISITEGVDGLAGPYSDIPGTVLSYEDPNKDPWEGSQGAAAFFIYWAINIRTPQGMIHEAKDTYWIYFTAATVSGFDCVGRIKVKVNKSQLKMDR